MAGVRPRSDSAPSIRAFIAVPVPEAARQSIGSLVEEVLWRRPEAGVRWVRPEGLHLTLRFLGQTRVDQLPAIREVIGEVAARHAPFDLEVSGGGAFPSLRRPRVLWLGLRRGEASLAALAADLDGRLERLGWEPEPRPYSAHLTLARADPGPAAAATAAVLVEASARLELLWRVEEVVLYESHLERGGARYVALERAPLGGRAARG